MLKTILSLVLCISARYAFGTQDTTRVLFIGNSLTYTYDVPSMGEGAADAAGPPRHAPVITPVEVHIEGFDKETFQVIVSYSLPHPLPDDETLNALKRKVNMKVYELISASATIGTPIGTA